MEARPTNRNWPSFSEIMRWKVCLHNCGDRNGSAPSNTSTKANAIIKEVPNIYFPRLPVPPLAFLRYLKNSESGCNTNTSVLLLKLFR